MKLILFKGITVHLTKQKLIQTKLTMINLQEY